MTFEEKKLSRKERKAIEAQQLREQQETDAKMQALMEKKKVQRLITDIEKSERGLLENAAAAKAKGYSDIYRQQISALKIARARKIQAEKFLFQIDSMEKMKALSTSSSDLLNAMGNIMGSLGKLALDKEEMRKTQQNFIKSQQNLDRQSRTIDQFFGQLEMYIPDETDDVLEEDVGLTDAAIEEDIRKYLETTGDSAKKDDTVAMFQGMLGN